MPEIELQRFRRLRKRANDLLQSLVDDLTPFRHDSVDRGFLRTPDSQSLAGDTNVTTTCSCLMGLALTGTLPAFYAADPKDTVSRIFNNILTAPWMSSGLAENNAFTTTLVLRTAGFLLKSGAIKRGATLKTTKRWEPQLDIRNFPRFAKRLNAKKRDPISAFLFSLMSTAQQEELAATASSTGDKLQKIRRDVTSEIARIIRTTALYESKRFSGTTLSTASREMIGQPQSAYTTAQLNRLLLDDAYDEVSPLNVRTLPSIATILTKDLAQFSINDYSSSPVVVYWFVDGVARSEIELPKEHWEALCAWAAAEFRRQRSLVVAQHAAMMDPVAMAMAACLCARLRTLSNRGELGLTSSHQAILPSLNELEKAIRELFALQTRSGIWPKYFPLFHYQEAGSNFCFTFELLEAVLSEFSDERNTLIEDPKFVSGLERAVSWCEKNLLQYSKDKDGRQVVFRGWNSGGFIRSLEKGQPESWATAVVHMFLWELSDVLSRHIQRRLIAKYNAAPPNLSARLSKLLEIQVYIDSEHKDLRKVVEEGIVKTFADRDERSLRAKKARGPVSALLFGPPGTSKTQIAKAVAGELKWPLVQIDPSHFLQSSLQNIYVTAETIFEDINDLSGVVVLFDEMDALVQTRSSERIDTEARFLTTYMLPKLAALHDGGRIAFLMATNFQELFDDAIKRAGRFDLLLCMGPPTLRAKCGSIHSFFGLNEPTAQTRKAGETIMRYASKDADLREQLELYTFNEFRSLLERIGTKANIGNSIVAKHLKGFRDEVTKDSATVGLKLDDIKSYLKDKQKQAISDLDPLPIEFSDDELKKRAVRYLRDRKESKRQ